MKGLELAEKYYEAWGAPMIREKLSDHAHSIHGKIEDHKLRERFSVVS